MLTDGILQIKSVTEKNDSIIEIKHDKRMIDRVAVSKMEYGTFTDEVISGHLIDSYYRHSFSVNKEGGKWRMDKMSEICKKQKKLRKYINGISKNVNERDLYFSSHFKSLAQIVEIINDSNSNEEFCDNLLKTKHITTGSLDWYFDYEHAKNMENAERS